MIDLTLQTNIVVKQLMSRNKMSRREAFDTWEMSKTKKYLEDNNLDYVSGMRCYWELLLELNNDRRWLHTPFDM